MVHTAECLGIGAQYYNLALIVIVLVLYILLLATPNLKRAFLKPWKYIFASLCIYVVEQIISIINTTGIMTVHPLVFPMLEFFIITIFIYALLTMKEHLKGKK
jgi:hypothetical protein